MKQHEDGAPCAHVEPLLQQVADGSLKGFRLWFAVFHSARCGRCGTYLSRLRETVSHLRQLRAGDLPPDVLSRLEKSIPKST